MLRWDPLLQSMRIVGTSPNAHLLQDNAGHAIATAELCGGRGRGRGEEGIQVDNMITQNLLLVHAPQHPTPGKTRPDHQSVWLLGHTSSSVTCQLADHAQGKMDTETNSVVTVGFTTKVDHQTSSKNSKICPVSWSWTQLVLIRSKRLKGNWDSWLPWAEDKIPFLSLSSEEKPKWARNRNLVFFSWQLVV